MSIMPLRTLLEQANQGKYAVGAFNIVNHLTTKAVLDACEKVRSPVIIQMSVKTVKQIGIKETVETILPLIAGAKVPATLHLDHCTDIEFAKACIDAGFPSIMIDASKKSLAENICITCEIKDYGKGRTDIEGELGAIVGVEENVVVEDDDGRLADVESARIYVEKTGVDAFAPAIGTAHGLYKGTPKIDFQRFADIRAVCDAPLVVHGGTGLRDEVFRRLIELGAAKINISTALKIAYIAASRTFLTENPDLKEPIKLDGFVAEQVSQMAETHLKLFGSDGKA